MNASDNNLRSDDGGSILRNRHLPLALLFVVFAISAFAMNPRGWGWFDWVAVTAFSLLAVWEIRLAILRKK